MENLLSQALGQDVSKLAVEEKQMLLSRLLAHLAHEIRNPLSSLDIHVQLLTEDLERAPVEVRNQMSDRLEVIRGELHRLESVVKHYLSLAGPSAVSLQAVDLRAIAEHVTDLLSPEAAARDIVLAVRTVSEIPVIQADQVRLTQALLNVVINALQAVKRHGKVIIELAAGELGGPVRIAVSDSGPGIPTESRSAVFEPFFTTKAGGGGLGLWIVQQIMLAHHGTIQVGTSEEGGALVTLALPGSQGQDGAHG